jgi:hypothetical protein
VKPASNTPTDTTSRAVHTALPEGAPGGRGRRGRQRLGCCSCWFAVGHASSQGSVVLAARMWFSICRRYAPYCLLRPTKSGRSSQVWFMQRVRRPG